MDARCPPRTNGEVRDEDMANSNGVTNMGHHGNELLCTWVRVMRIFDYSWAMEPRSTKCQLLRIFTAYLHCVSSFV